MLTAILFAGLVFLALSVRRAHSRLDALETAAASLSMPAPPPSVETAPRGGGPRFERPRVEWEAGQEATPAPPPSAETAPRGGGPRFEQPRVEWEAVLGGNWLNKAGVALLVIGIALLLGYSFHRMTAPGRVALGAGLGAVMLAAGAFSERRAGFRIFGHGLLGGGWAALYFTCWAAYSLPAARVLTSPVLATLLLGAVAAGAIVHALRYRSQTVAAMAWLLGFATLAISDVPTLALAASLPLVGSLLYVSRKFNWSALALASIPVVYGLFAVHAARMPGGNPAVAQALVLLYWLLFEASEPADRPGLRRFVLNAAGFVPCGWLIWNGAPAGHWVAPAIAASVYTAAGVARAWLGAPFLPSVTVSAALTAIAILSRFTGFAAGSALLAEGEVLWLLGLVFGRPYLRALGTAVLIAFQVHFFAMGLPDSGRSWVPTASVAALVCYANRTLHPGSRYFGYAGAALAALVAWAEVPAAWLGPAWLLAGALCLELGLRRRLPDLLFHSAGFAGLAGAALAWVNVAGHSLPAGPLPWGPQLCAVVLLFAAAVRLRSSDGRAQTAAAVAGAGMAMAFLWTVLPAVLTAPAWAVLAVAMTEAARVAGARGLANAAHLAALAALPRLLAANLGLAGAAPAAVIVAAAHYWQFARSGRFPRFRRVYLYAAALSAVLLIRTEVPTELRVLGWSAIMLALFGVGLYRDLQDLRFQAYALGAVVFARFLMAFDGPSPGRIPISIAVAAAFFVLHLMARNRRPDTIADACARHATAVLGALAVAVLLFREVSGGMLTMAWGVEGIGLLASGFVLRGRTLRLTGLAAFLGCVLKLFLYDLRNLETPYRIASFLVLGALLISVSWAYTRFRDKLERYL